MPGTESALGPEGQRALLVRLARVGTSALPFTQLVEQLLKQVVESLDVYACHMHLIEGSELVFVGKYGGDGNPDDIARIQRLAINDRTLAGRAVQGRVPIVSSVDEWPELTRDLIRKRGIHFGVALPLLLQDRAIGSLYALRRVARPFSRDELELLEACCAHAAAAVEHARLLEAERHRFDDLKVLLDVGRAITGSLDLEQILEASAISLARIVSASHSFIWLLSSDGKQLKGVVTSAREHQEHFRQVRLTLDDPSLAARAIVSRGPVSEQAALSSPQVNQGLNARYQMKSLLAMPLMLRGEPLGVAVIGDAIRERQWTDAEIERATVVSGQVAVAVANARLFEDLKRSYDALERTQVELVKREQLAALGELSAVVAHEVRNPLGVIYNSMSALKRLAPPSGEAVKVYEMIEEEAARIDTIVADLLDFARPHEPQLQPESLEQVIAGAVKVTEATRAGAGVKIRVEIGELLPLVPLDERMLRQALLNLLVNAAQAMPQGGEIRVRLGLGVRKGLSFARIDISDEGPGVPAALSQSVFRPFVTTKATGTGLGLAVVKRIIDAHHGEIELSSAPGRGATFTVWLPA